MLRGPTRRKRTALVWLRTGVLWGAALLVEAAWLGRLDGFWIGSTTLAAIVLGAVGTRFAARERDSLLTVRDLRRR